MEKHDLHTEFPELSDKITELKVNNAHFRKLFDEYHSFNKEIHGIEVSGKYTDSELKEKRMKRVHLKDQLIAILKGF